MIRFSIILFLLTISIGSTFAQSPPLFRELPASQTGVNFSNVLTEDSIWNPFFYLNIYNGGGVAVGDLNNDGLPDLYFTGNQVKNRLFLNQGGMKFKDISTQSGTGGTPGWTTGVTLADVNADGWLDIYVCQAGQYANPLALKNLLYINNGPNSPERNDLTFTEQADQYGIADPGRSVHAAFFDYDSDGDLDLYVLNHPDDFNTPLEQRIAHEQKPNDRETDRLYRNDGGHFTDVTDQAGLRNWGFGLSVVAADMNGDGWADLYVANDYSEPDYYWINNRDGTFRNGTAEAFGHISNFSMGADLGDINNDGAADLMVVDMMARDNRRKKTNMSGMNPAAFWDNVNKGRHYQYMQNVLQMSNGDGSFSDIAEMAGVDNTDWSWSPLFADLDNDGYQDLIITNGMRRDIRDNDFSKTLIGKSIADLQTNWKALLDKMPSEKMANFAYRNQGDLTFTDESAHWGLNHRGFSTGAALADLDRDGDLDLVLNNVDESASVIENQLEGRKSLRVVLKGAKNNPFAYGARVKLYAGTQVQSQQVIGSRGFQSSSETILHFGTQNWDRIDYLEVKWPNRTTTTLKGIPASGDLVVRYGDAGVKQGGEAETDHRMQNITATAGLDFMHREIPFDDYEEQVLLPHTYSQNGPLLASGDVNGDGRDDLFVGGAAGQSGQLYLQGAKHQFAAAPQQPWKVHADREDMGALFFDADGDGDMDLYIASGSNEMPRNDARYRDRLYKNDGKGNFSDASDLLPDFAHSSGRVRAADIDGDGDQDLFVCGRVIPGQYPFPAQSELLLNHNGRFIPFTDKLFYSSPRGLVTDARFSDVDKDGDPDLLLVGEWMSPTLFLNNGGHFKDASHGSGLENHVGWWYSLQAADLDGDGDEDFVAGNLGLNTKYRGDDEEPFLVYAGDLDKNGKSDIVLGYHQDGVPYPVRGRQCSSDQLPSIKEKFPSYGTFARASLTDIYGGVLSQSLNYAANWMQSSWIENLGQGRFKVHTLPNEAQVSTVNAALVTDFNNDKQVDIILAGNMYGAEVETCRHDASMGLVLSARSDGGYQPLPQGDSGFRAAGDVKDLALLSDGKGGRIIVVARNSAGLLVYKMKQD